MGEEGGERRFSYDMEANSVIRCEDCYEVSLKDCEKLLEERGVNVSGEGGTEGEGVRGGEGCEWRRGDWRRGV